MRPTITTPLMLYKIMSYTQMGLHEKQFAYAMDILMVIAGLIGALVCGSDKWIFFGFSMLAFLASPREAVRLRHGHPYGDRRPHWCPRLRFRQVDLLRLLHACLPPRHGPPLRLQ